MDAENTKRQLNAVIPGVVEAYDALRTPEGTGIYTSSDSFYNHTFFGRDSSMAAKFMLNHDHPLARQAIIFLASIQGSRTDTQTQEQPGRIHHELRDFRKWSGSWSERRVLKFFARLWGMRDQQLLTYFAADTTALFIRLTYKYAKKIDPSILQQKVTYQSGEQLTVGEAVARAADWIISQTDERGVVMSWRSNKWALPFQTFQDSTTSYVRTDLSLADYKHGIAYVEVQSYASDALEEAAQLLSDHDRNEIWHREGERLGEALFREFWNERDNYFASAIDKKGQIDMRNVSAGWTLNISAWSRLPEEERAAKISHVVRRLFSSEFLTSIGLRTRSVAQAQPLIGTIEYHGTSSVWPMFTFMVVEGLRRHRLYRLADQLQNRLINALNASGQFDEFFMVNTEGELMRIHDSAHPADTKKVVQMIPEGRIAFSVVPALTLAYRVIGDEARLQPKQWQAELEKSILATIPLVDRVEPRQASIVVGPVHYIYAQRWRANIRTSWYFVKQSRKLT